MDAIVAERLTSSPRIYNIYTMCGLGLVSEFFVHGDIQQLIIPNWGAHPKDGYDPQNTLPSREKLVVAKQMADAVADLHGYKGGVMVHQDIQLSQFLWNNDKSMVKLNDFNRAEFMLYNEKEREYCKYYEGQGVGTWRSAEEYYDKALDEKVDIFSLGNNFYGILTGMQPFYDIGEQVADNPQILVSLPIDFLEAFHYTKFPKLSFPSSE
jgi:serine/threonine protein kinase